VARQPRTLLEHIYVRTRSMKATVRVGTLVTQWAIVRRDLGRRPMVSEYCEWWGISEATAYRELAEFRKAFPGEDGPDRIAAVLNDQGDELREKLTPAWVLSASPAGLVPAT
jgi:hypothetical protein